MLRHEPLVADEPMHAVPWNPASTGIARKQPVELSGTRPAGEADRDPSIILIDPSDDALRCCARKLSRVRDGDDLTTGLGHHSQNFRQLRPSRFSKSSAACGPSLPA